MSMPEKPIVLCGEKACVTAEAGLDSGADFTLVASDIAQQVGLPLIGEKTLLQSVTGEEIEVEFGFVSVDMGNGCHSLKKVGVAPRESMGGEDVLVGNDYIEAKRMKLNFQGEGLVGIHCPLPKDREK